MRIRVGAIVALACLAGMWTVIALEGDVRAVVAWGVMAIVAAVLSTLEK